MGETQSYVIGDEQGWEETKLVDSDDVSPIPKSTFHEYEGRMNPCRSHSLACEQGSKMYGGNPCV